ncbi:MAG: DUF559 domain-containing protein, partial [Candidatus Methylomirabilis sp.]|nr:DUF559 domain-containing protein [Deltaproteobacteria bacterium]
LIVEVDGGQHADRGVEDAERTAWLESQGFQVLRFWNHEALLETEAAVERIYDVVRQRLGHEDDPPS